MQPAKIQVVKMKVLPFVFLIICYLYPLNARLLVKKPEAQSVRELKSTQAPQSPLQRFTRQIFEEETSLAFSREIEDDVRPYEKKTRPPSKPFTEKTRVVKKYRVNTTENIKKHYVAPTKPTVVLVKKPIPKFKEIDYYDDFQLTFNRDSIKFIDSGDHEDEDFNLDDYDFDINHDEFAGRGKPLEPRLKLKIVNVEKDKIPELKLTSVSPPEINIQSKVIIPTMHRLQELKKSKVKKAADKIKEDYYDDVMTDCKDSAKEKPKDEEEVSDENEESKEYDHRIPIVRNARSSLSMLKQNISKKIDKGNVKLNSKLRGILPMFPEVPSEKHSHDDFSDIARLL